MKQIVSKYQQLALALREEIISGRLPAGAQLPTEEKLMKQYGFSRETVRKAIGLLAADGFVRRVQGLGSFVETPHPNAIAFHFAETSNQRHNQQNSVSYRVLRQEVQPASLEYAEMLKIMPGTPVIHLAQVKIENAVPVSYSERHLPLSLCPALAEADLTQHSVHDLLSKKVELPPMRAVIEIEARSLTEKEAQWLEVPPGTPAILVNRLSYTAPNQPAVWYRGLFRDRYTMEVELEVNPSQRKEIE